jgi:hypothetical protein
MKKFLLAAGCLGCLAMPAVAQNASWYHNNAGNWAAFDSNGDGHLHFSELRAQNLPVNSRIRGLDRDNNRILSPWELNGQALPNAYANRLNNFGAFNTYNNYPTASPYYNNYGYHYTAMDLNRNGILEAWELNQAGYQANNNYNMALLDINRDGYIDNYEMQRAGYANYNGINDPSTWLNLLMTIPRLIR